MCPCQLMVIHRVAVIRLCTLLLILRVLDTIGQTILAQAGSRLMTPAMDLVQLVQILSQRILESMGGTSKWTKCPTSQFTTAYSVYVGTNGRGIFYGDIASGAGVPVSTTAPNSVSSSTTVPTSVVSSTSASSPSASGIATAYGQCGGMSSTTHERVIAETTQVPIGQVQRLAYLDSNALKAMIVRDSVRFSSRFQLTGHAQFIPNVCRFEIKSDLV